MALEKTVVELRIADRIQLLNALPRQGNVGMMKTVRDLKESLEFTEEELEKFGLKFEGTQVQWTPAMSEETVPIAIGPRGLALVSETLEGLEKENKLPLDMLGVYELFCEEAAEE